MKTINQNQAAGLEAQAPAPSVMTSTTIIAQLEGTQNNSKTSSMPVQNTQSTGYIIYIMENKNTLNKHSLIK